MITKAPRGNPPGDERGIRSLANDHVSGRKTNAERG